MSVPHEDEYVAYVTAKMLWLRRVAYLLCQDWHHADDIAQATITNLYVKWRRARAATSLDAYVRTMLVRVYLGERRSPWARRVTLGVPAPDSATATAAADVETGVVVREALGRLTPRQRATVVLRFYCDLSVEQTAATLGCSTGTVKSQTARALDALRADLADEAPPAGRRPFETRGIRHG